MKIKWSNRPPFPQCPWCSAALPQNVPHRQACPDCGFILYHCSSPCMGAVPVDTQGAILLGRRGIEPLRGDWNTIGGFLGYGEEPMDGLRREVIEETGVDCIIKDYITMTADTYGPDGQALLNTYFTVELLSGDLRPQDDVAELRWFDLDDLPDNIAFASDRRALAALKNMLQCP